MRLPHLIRRLAVIVWALSACFLLAAPSDPRPVVGPGATKDDVINAYGWPNGQSQTGSKEILSYDQGEVILENGKVERVNFSPDVPWQKPKPRPDAPVATTRKPVEVPIDYWRTNFADALSDAQRRHVRILALFTGSDWSPASREFHEQVEYHPDFVNAFAGDFVFVKLDFPRGSPVPAKIPEENLKLRDLYDVTTYPTLLVLSPTGELLSRVDLMNPDLKGSFRDRVIAAVRDARDATPAPTPAAAAAPAPEPPPVAAPAEPAAPTPAVASTTPAPLAAKAGAGADATPNVADRAVWKAGRLIAAAMAVGAVIVLALWWWMWRERQPKPQVPALDMAERIDAAAGGLPPPNEMMVWPKEKLCAITARLAEFDNYSAHIRPPEGDVDIELRKRGDVNPRVLVACATGSEGVVSAKRLRELFASLAAEGVDNGWFVSPAGFSAEAREYAPSHRIVLVGSEGLHNLMREVPPVSLPGVLALG